MFGLVCMSKYLYRFGLVWFGLVCMSKYLYWLSLVWFRCVQAYLNTIAGWVLSYYPKITRLKKIFKSEEKKIVCEVLQSRSRRTTHGFPVLLSYVPAAHLPATGGHFCCFNYRSPVGDLLARPLVTGQPGGKNRAQWVKKDGVLIKKEILYLIHPLFYPLYPYTPSHLYSTRLFSTYP